MGEITAKVCKTDACERPAKKLGMCLNHYQQHRKATETRVCSIAGCSRKRHAKGLCQKHYGQVRAELRGLPCSTAGCVGLMGDGTYRLCDKCYRRQRYQGTLPSVKRCSVPTCSRCVDSHGYCRMHFVRWKSHGNPLIRMRPANREVSNGDGYLYTTVRVDGRRKARAEHRVVMEEHLGRSLSRKEVIHHIDGVRSNNRIENLAVLDQGTHVMVTALVNVFSRSPEEARRLLALVAPQLRCTVTVT